MLQSKITFLLLNNHPDMLYSQGGMKFTTQMSPLLNLSCLIIQNYLRSYDGNSTTQQQRIDTMFHTWYSVSHIREILCKENDQIENSFEDQREDSLVTFK